MEYRLQPTCRSTVVFSLYVGQLDNSNSVKAIVALVGTYIPYGCTGVPQFRYIPMYDA